MFGKQRIQYEVLYTPKRDIFRKAGIGFVGFIVGIAAAAGFGIYLDKKERNKNIEEELMDNDDNFFEEEES